MTVNGDSGTPAEERFLRKARKHAAKEGQEAYDEAMAPATIARDTAMQPHIQVRDEIVGQARQKPAGTERAARQACAEAIEHARRECREATSSAQDAFREATAPLDADYQQAERTARMVRQDVEKNCLDGYLVGFRGGYERAYAQVRDSGTGPH